MMNDLTPTLRNDLTPTPLLEKGEGLMEAIDDMA